MTIKTANAISTHRCGASIVCAMGALLVGTALFAPAPAHAGWLPRPELRPPTTSTACLITRFAPDALASAPACRPGVVAAAVSRAIPQDQTAVTRRRSLS